MNLTKNLLTTGRLIAGVALCFLLSWTSRVAVSYPQKGADGERKVLGPMTVQAPKGWIEKAAAGPMRRMQFNLPRAQGDSEDGELVVFYFGKGEGGSVEANINRWVGQFAQPDGTPSRNKAKIEKRQVSGMNVTTVDLKGTYQASMTPMATERVVNKPGFRLLAAIVETPEGSYFFKLTGPEKTIARWADSFQQFINSIQKR